MGDFLIAMAKKEPESNFVGIDFSKDCISKLLQSIDSLQLKNIRVIFGDVREKLPYLFKDQELDSVFINLPDPWPKKRQHKRTLLSLAISSIPQGIRQPDPADVQSPLPVVFDFAL